MNNTEEPQKQGGLQKFATGFEAVMAILYLVFASIFLFPSWWHIQLNFNKGICIGFGIILAVYGVFRIYRAIKKL
ncbi:MAG: hypothetical protein LBG77_01925 [Dysgonamonadaceae bacterium]|jgi:uncharacterized membrane protein (DUF485 family)|nr:hypothetical protein [Dysgonamonadaceae bacterium]